MLYVEVNTVTTLSLVLSDGRTDLYGQARVYDGTSLVSTVNLNHLAEGIYAGAYTPSTEGTFQIVYEAYSDAGRTVPAGYGKQGEALDVGSYRSNILRLLGLLHDNALVDQQIYDVESNLTGARIRVYDTTVNLLAAQAVSPAAYNTGLRFTYNVSATYTSGLLSKYYINRS